MIVNLSQMVNVEMKTTAFCPTKGHNVYSTKKASLEKLF